MLRNRHRHVTQCNDNREANARGAARTYCLATSYTTLNQFYDVSTPPQPNILRIANWRTASGRISCQLGAS